MAISNGGDNYFPTIAYDSDGNRLVAAWFTNQFDGLPQPERRNK